MIRIFSLISMLITAGFYSKAQYDEIKGVPAKVDFSNELHEWDGFGFNYVETAHTYNYIENSQDYGGFSLLNQKEKKEIIELVFGENGLRPGIIKMFLDPLHQSSPDAEFDHKTSTTNMREFVGMGLEKMRERGEEPIIFTTLYAPPYWASKQKINRGRDLNPNMKEKVAFYIIDWVQFLIKEGFPVKYISLHNEGDDWQRWPADGSSGYSNKDFDYNMYWPPEQVNEFLCLLPQLLEKEGLSNIGLSNGEPTKWFRFSHWGYAQALVNNPLALENLDIVMSHDFYNGEFSYWYGGHSAYGLNQIRKLKPDIHAWSTSSAWKNSAWFIRQMHGSIYEIGVNGFIPWAGLQAPFNWNDRGDPNPCSAFTISKNGNFTINQAYYYFKQVCMAGRPGMKVVYTESRDSEIPILAFSSGNTKNPDCFVVINYSTGWSEPERYAHKIDKDIVIKIKGSEYKMFSATRTNGKNEQYKNIGIYQIQNGEIFYHAPDNTVTTFFGLE